MPPHWVERLGGLHDAPYYLRYSTGVHGIVMPPLQLMVSGLVELHDTVDRRLKRENP
jgi:hypothetical protein